MKRYLLFIILSIASGIVYAQSSPGYPWQFGQTLTSSAINAAFNARATYSSGPLSQYSVLIGNGLGDITTVSSLGTNGQILSSQGAGLPPIWITSNVTNPMTSVGDMIIGGTSGVQTRLAVGSNTNVLTISGGVPVWSASNYVPGAVAITGGSISNTSVSATTLSASGTIIPTYPTGIAGSTTTTSITAGSIGETITSTGTAVSLTSGVVSNITSISITAGHWLLLTSGSFNPAGSTTATIYAFGASPTSVTLPASPNLQQEYVSVPAGDIVALAAPSQFLKLGTTTTYYCTMSSTFAVSTMTGTCILTAVRL